MKLIKVRKQDSNDQDVARAFNQEASRESQRQANKANGFVSYEFVDSEWNKNSYVEVIVSMPSSSGDGSGKQGSVDEAIKVTEARLASLRECKAKLKKLQDEAKRLGLKLEK